MKRTLSILLLLGFTLHGLFAQSIDFKSKMCNTGKSLWKTPVTARFQFTNKDARNPLRIERIDAGCGCLKAQYTQGNIAKGESGEIAITYDAMLLGHYDRIVEVYTNASDKPERLRIKGVISNSKAENIDNLYPIRIDNICLNTNNIEFPDVSRGDSTVATLEIFNDGTEVFTPRLMHLPPYITARMVPEMIARNRKGKIILTLHGDKVTNLGLNQSSIYLARYAGDHVGPNNEIVLSAVMLPDLAALESRAKQPVFELSATKINLGKLGKKTKLKTNVIIKNTGTAPLQISNMQAFSHALTVSLPQSEIMPGNSVKMQIELYTRFLAQSKTNTRILIITNDPLHSKEVIDVVFE